ncbi:DnaB-like helicase N-terminal domain-containing protein [Streptomyces sp. NPDC054933]
MPHPTNPYEEDLDDLPAPQPVHYAEQALLGALLLAPHRLSEIDALEPAHFGNHAHGALFQGMREVPAPEAEQHRDSLAWPNAILASARPNAPGLTASYLHTLIHVCPWPKHAAAYARMIRADHARRVLRMHAERLAQTAADVTLPNRAIATLHQADTLARFLDDLSSQFAPHPGSLPRTPLSPAPPRDTGEEALDEERFLLASATALPGDAKEMRWLVPEDFAAPLHAALWQCLTALTHRGEPVDPVTVLWEAQHRGLLTHDMTPADLLALISTPLGSAEHWGEKVVQRALLARAHAVASRVTAYTDDPANTTHQLINGSRRALADLTALRTRWQRTASPAAPAVPRPVRTPSAPRAGPLPRAATASPARATR